MDVGRGQLRTVGVAPGPEGPDQVVEGRRDVRAPARNHQDVELPAQVDQVRFGQGELVQDPGGHRLRHDNAERFAAAAPGDALEVHVQLVAAGGGGGQLRLDLGPVVHAALGLQGRPGQPPVLDSHAAGGPRQVAAGHVAGIGLGIDPRRQAVILALHDRHLGAARTARRIGGRGVGRLVGAARAGDQGRQGQHLQAPDLPCPSVGPARPAVVCCRHDPLPGRVGEEGRHGQR